jgi:transcriptional regulator with XRE-family HTH domain
MARTELPLHESVPALLEGAGEIGSLRALADAVGHHVSFLSRVLNGERRVTVELLEKVATALGVPSDYFPEYRELKVAAAVASDGDLRDCFYDELPAAWR